MATVATQSDDVRELALWALESLGCQPKRQGEIYRASIPLAHRPDFDHREQCVFTFAPDLATAVPGGEPEWLGLDAPLFDCIIRAVRAGGPAVHARILDQPQSVHEVARRLLPAYQVAGGKVHLGGCQLTDRPFLRLTYASLEGNGVISRQLRQVYVDPTGEMVSKELVSQLRLEEAVPWSGVRSPRLAGEELKRWVRGAHRLIMTDGDAETSDQDDAGPLLAVVVWCKYVTGKLLFTIGETVEELSFASWGVELTPPPFLCRHTGASTFELAGTDDGRIVAANQIETCGLTGRRVLRSELVECAVTGRRILPEQTVLCPVVNQPVLKGELAACTFCQQAVSPKVLKEGVCAACRSLSPVAKADPRMARLLDEHPGLDRWRNWKIAETATAYIAVASGPLRRLLVVVEKQSLEPLWLALGSRLWRSWKPLSGPALEEQIR